MEIFEVLQDEFDELLLQLLHGLVDIFVCKGLKIPDISGDLICYFDSLFLFDKSEEEFSFSESSEAVELDEFLRIPSSRI